MDLIKIKLENYQTDKEEVELQFLQDIDSFGDDSLRVITNSISLTAGMIGKMLPEELQSEYLGILVRTVSDMLNQSDLKEESFEDDIEEALPKNAIKLKPGCH